MTRRGAQRGVAVLLLVVGACLLAPAPSRAATIESGWWWKANNGSKIDAPPPVPPTGLPVAPPAPPGPPTADGGLQVAGLPDGAFAIAAVRVDEELTSLTLRVAPNGEANSDQAKLVACAAATPWEPVVAGQWDQKPVVACDLINGGGSVAGIRAGDGMSWTFPVAPLADDGKTDVVIVPLATSDLAPGVAAPFQIVFVPPTSTDLVIAPATEDTAAPSDEFVGDAFTDNSTTFDPTTFGGGFTDAAPVVRPALGANDQAPVLPAFSGTPVEPDNASQAVGAVLVLLGIGGLLWGARQPIPAVQSLVRGGREIPGVAPQVGGLGRFARHREGRPPSLQ
jgi:hypothetical protein